MSKRQDGPRTLSPADIRARELCQAAGIDPDSRVPKDGSPRGQPAWVTYRAQVLAELRDSEMQAAHAAVAALPQNMAQPAHYQNAPLHILGDHEPNTIKQMKFCMQFGNVVRGALCGDAHLGYAQPVGAAIAYENQISISGIGFDQHCGNMAVKLDIPFGQIRGRLDDIADDIARTISFGVGRKNEQRVERALFDNDVMWRDSGMAYYKDKARAQLGTVGSGNHYVDVFYDTTPFSDPEFVRLGGGIDDCPVWIGVHFGSRGFGHTTATQFLKAAGGKDGIHAVPAIVDVRSDLGEQFLAALALTSAYAYAGREWVVERVRKIIGGHVIDSVHNHHNAAWPEEVADRHGAVRKCWVVRKGCTPAHAGERGFVGGSMGDEAVIVRGKPEGSHIGDIAQRVELVNSTVHGAGRTMGRREAIRTFTQEAMDDWLARAKVVRRGGGLDESPMAYRRLSTVLGYHDASIDIESTLAPAIVVMAGADDSQKDPFRD